MKVGNVVIGSGVDVSHNLSQLNGVKLVVIHSVGSPSKLLLKGSISELESLLGGLAEKRVLCHCAIFGFQVSCFVEEVRGQQLNFCYNFIISITI